MITRDEVEKLAKLARLHVPAEELDKLAKDLESILGYVSELKNAPVGESKETHRLLNVLRMDEAPHEAGIYTNELMAAMNQAKNNYLAVKPILDKNAG